MATEGSEPSVTRFQWWAPPCYFLGLGLFLWGLYVLGRPYYVDDDLRADIQKARQLDDARYVVVGSSHGRDVDLEALGVEGQNLSHNGQDLFEMVYIVRSAVKRAPQLETVIITLSYFTFALDNAAYERGGVRDRIGRRVQMYSAFPRAAFLPGDQAEFAKGLLYPIVTRDHFQRGFERNLRRFLRFFSDRPERAKRSTARAADSGRAPGVEPAPAADEVEGEPIGDPDLGNDIGEEPRAEEFLSPAERGDDDRGAPKDAKPKPERPVSARPHLRKDEAWYARHAAARCRQYSGLMDNSRDHHPNLERDAYRELLGLLRELEAKHISVVLFTPPYLPAYSACFDQRMQRLTRVNATRLTELTHARYLDLSTDATFMTRLTVFEDSDHLRPKGKQVLARTLAGLLQLQ